jgi:hypothetical protein
MQTTLMNHIQRLNSILPINNTADIDLTSSLTYHLDINIPLCERGEHFARDTDHVPHVFADEGEDGHVAVDGDLRGRKRKRY